MAYYGQDVFATLRAGQHLREVEVYTAPDSTEKFDKAFQALDGELNLLAGSGARLLVVVSDGRYTDKETERCKHWLARADKAGVAILWLEYDGSPIYIERHLTPPTAKVVSVGRSLTDSALAIGKSACEALEAISARQ
jgi:hypothetical protein